MVAGILGVIAEVLLTLSVVCALYIVWQLWWTGVESAHAQLQQRQEQAWADPQGGGKIAQPQSGAPPVQPTDPHHGDLIGQLYVPRFGEHWHRNIVEGTSLDELNRHGLGHYESSQLPGQLGNFAVAGHRSGYGEPLAHVDTLRRGDAIVVRTEDYWYVYHYTTFKIVLPDAVEVVAPNPENPAAAPTKRMITLTTCEPRYQTATHRWISWGDFGYWAKVSDGIPKELAADADSGTVKFQSQPSDPLARLGSLLPVVLVLLAAYAIIYLAALVTWRYPMIHRIRTGELPRPQPSIYGWLLRVQPGVTPVRWLLLLLLIAMAIAALFQWGFPWLAANVPYLQVASNYVSVG